MNNLIEKTISGIKYKFNFKKYNYKDIFVFIEKEIYKNEIFNVSFNISDIITLNKKEIRNLIIDKFYIKNNKDKELIIHIISKFYAIEFLLYNYLIENGDKLASIDKANFIITKYLEFLINNRKQDINNNFELESFNYHLFSENNMNVKKYFKQLNEVINFELS